MKIQLTRGLAAEVDAEDFVELSKYKWHATEHRRPARRQGAGPGTLLYMYRVIMRAPAGSVVDHINGDALDNRRSNLRICIQGQNSWNGSAHRDSGSEFKGVHWAKSRRKWVSQIRVSDRRITLGAFAHEIEAALAYDAAARLHHGEFARCNYPDES